MNIVGGLFEKKESGKLGYLKHDRLNECGTFERECHYESLNIH